MQPPSDLDRKSKALWKRTRDALLEQGTWTDADYPLLERYIRALQRAREAREVADADPYVKGSTGQLVAHPARKIERDAELDAHRYAESLLLTPQTRKRAGVGEGDEPEDDEAAEFGL